MAPPIDPSRSPLQPVAQFLAEAASQRQSALLGLDKPIAAPAPLPGADPSAPPPSVGSPGPPAGPLPAPAGKASISLQAREQLAAGFDPRGASAADGNLQGALGGAAALRAAPQTLPSGAPAMAGSAAAPAASYGVGGTAWPTSGLSAPLLRLVSALVAQVTAHALQQATTGRLDPWTQMAVLQASGQVPREDERGRNGASGLCATVGCPYAARAACVQPFCLALRGVVPPEPVGPTPLA